MKVDKPAMNTLWSCHVCSNNLQYKGHRCRKAAKEKPLPLHSREAKGVYLPATNGDHIPATTARVAAKIPSMFGVIFGLCMCLTQAA